MRPDQIRLIAGMLTDDPDVFCEMGGDMAGGGMPGAGPAAKPEKPPVPGAPGTQDVVDAGEEKPLTTTEINKQAQDVGQTADASAQVAQQMEMQQELMKQQEEQQAKILQPQIDALNQSLEKLGAGVTQGKAAAGTSGEQFADLEKEMANIQTLVGSLQKAI